MAASKNKAQDPGEFVMQLPEGFSEDLSLDVKAWYSPEVALAQKKPVIGKLEKILEWEETTKIQGQEVKLMRKALIVRLSQEYPCGVDGKDGNDNPVIVPMSPGDILGVGLRSGLEVLADYVKREVCFYPKELIPHKQGRSLWKFGVHAKEASFNPDHF